MSNRFEAAARAHKVKLLVGHLLMLRATADEARVYPLSTIEALSAEVGVKMPSMATWALVVDALPSAGQPTLFERAKPRRTWDAVDRIVAELEPHLAGVEHHWGGSYRRHADTVGDLDLVVVTDGPLSEAGIGGPLACDRSELVQYSRDVDQPDGTAIQVDVWRATPDKVGPFMAFVSGPKEWNVICRTRAIERGWKLSQHGLLDRNGRRLDENTEASIFRLLELPTLTPEERHDWRRHVGRSPSESRKAG